MRITDRAFTAFLDCKTKCLLYLDNQPSSDDTEFVLWSASVQAQYEVVATDRMSATEPAGQIFRGTPPSPELRTGSNAYGLILGYEATTAELQSRLHALVLTRGEGARRGEYAPVRFLHRNKLNSSDRLRLAFDALAVSQDLGYVPTSGKLIHGQNYREITIKLAPWVKKARRLLTTIPLVVIQSAPQPALNKHCSECEFQNRCRQIAAQNDDLSLLVNMTEKERRRQNDKGIFTITQLSYTFRPRRGAAASLRRHHHALQALAVRTQRIHVLGGGASKDPPSSPVYIDIEGDPDRDTYYLVGLRVCHEGNWVQHSFWADDSGSEKAMWENTLGVMRDLENPTLVHYGSYETTFLRTMRRRYGNCLPGLAEALAENAINLLSVIYTSVYFPTYSNRLKEIGEYIGFRWSAHSASGLNALVWRSGYEQTQSPALKEKLITYNAEDCHALQLVAETVWKVLHQGDTRDGNVVDATKLRKEFPQRFGNTDFLLPEFKAINEAAYWDYQRSKVYVRTGTIRPHNRLKERCFAQANVPANKVVRIEDARPGSCTHCNGTLIYKWGTLSQTVFDLKFGKAGIKRWVVRFVFHRFICWKCKRPLQPYTHKPKYGVGLFAYVLYEMFEMGASQNAIAASLRRLFGLPFSRGAVNHLKETAAVSARTSFDEILHRIVNGKLIHIDETKAPVAGRDGYVWVFASMEDVAFVYKATREAEFVREMLKTFKGVVVSDYFSGYDTLPCAQQKCLIHLMRDINDDLRKQPFNEEMRSIAEWFAALVRPMIAAVDRYGLKARHLRKYLSTVNKFYITLQCAEFQTEVARGYEKRFERNRSKLFTFLEHDGVPWNNNNAEHAIKAFARLRRTMGGSSTVKGLEEYLVLLSVSETCKARGGDTLGLFLRQRSTWE